MSLRTLNDIFFSLAERNLPRVMMHRVTNAWVPISSQELYRKVCGTARALQQCGIAKGDRVAILSENRPEWAIADFAALLIGAISVPIYSTLTEQQAAHILNDSGARLVFVSSDKQLAKVLALRNQTGVEKIIVMDELNTDDAVPMRQLMEYASSGSDTELERTGSAISSDDPASIIYTSGTTGTPKGAVLTHGNLTANITCSLAGFEVGPEDISISFLPLSHVTARHADFALLYRGVTLAYCSFIEQVPQVLREVRPTIFVAVPRVYEKIYNQAVQKVRTAPKSAIYRWALSVGERQKPHTLAGRKPTAISWKLADKLVFSKIREAVGGRARLYISGGAPLGRELAEWFAAIGIRIHEGYGLTETSPIIAVNTPQDHRIGSVGKPLPNLQLRFADDGELLVRGPSVFAQYWNRPEETESAFSDGWFKTGDIGHLDADGFLSITDRKKDLIKTSGGKYIAPQPLESSLKHNPLVAEAVVVGDRRKFPVVLILPDFALLEHWAAERELAFSSREDLVANPQVQVLYKDLVHALNQQLAQFERLKKVIVLAQEFSTQDGTLTPSMKLRRRVVEDRYREQIEALYLENEVAVMSR